GIYAESSNISLDNVTISDNQSTVQGGGFASISSTVIIQNSRFEDNRAVGIITDPPDVQGRSLRKIVT
ncbi:MAG: right-handed parallel beta-helix repeat-containing protein, partial [Chloroflexota bacterium]